MLGGDHRHEHPRLQSERTSHEHSMRDHEAPPRPTKRNPDQHHERDRDHDRDRHHHHRPESSKLAPETVTKATSTTATAAMDKSQKTSVFSRISFPEEHSRKRRLTSDAPASSGHHKSTSNGYYDDYKTSSAAPKAISGTSGSGRKSSRSNAVDYESSDDDRHFKRKPSRYSRSPSDEWIEQPRHSRGSKERDRSSYNKHR